MGGDNSGNSIDRKLRPLLRFPVWIAGGVPFLALPCAIHPHGARRGAVSGSCPPPVQAAA
jgi:hypothetical protein